MHPAPIPAYGSERLAALRALLVLDTPPEERFDRIVQFAADEFDVPMALLSLVDEQRQWFKARVGLGLSEAC
jgi:GAF domain-containing protein